jgi:ankyrin repeat protein
MKSLCNLLIIFVAMFSLNALALNDDQELEFTGAVNDGDLKTVKMYIETTDVKIDDSYFAWTPFLMTAAKGQLKVMEYLVSKGADITYTHPITEFNALHHAAFNGHKAMVDFLVKIGIDKTKKLKGDVSIIRALKEDGKNKMAEYLLSIGFKDEGCQEKKCF